MDHTRASLKGVFPSLFVLLLATLPFCTPPYTTVAVTSILMYVVLTVSWAMFCGPTRYMSLATATFFGVGMYTSAVLGERLPFPLVVACGGLFSFCIGLLTGFICLRLRGFYFAISRCGGKLMWPTPSVDGLS
jgi:branched-chain amino acid transport system permease protein